MPDALDGLLITQPGKDLTEKELRRLDQFVMKGKALAVFAGAVNIAAGDETMNATLSHTARARPPARGLRHLCSEGCRARLWAPRADSGDDGERAGQLGAAGDPRCAERPALESRCSATRQHLSRPVSARRSRGALRVEPHGSEADRQPDARTRILMRSSRSAFHLTGDRVDLRPLQKWAPKVEGRLPQSFAIAADVEGTLRTAFQGAETLGAISPSRSARSARIFVVASSQFLANPLARAGNKPGRQPLMPAGDEQLLLLAAPYAHEYTTGPLLVFKDTLDWLMDDGFANCFRRGRAAHGGG